MRFLTVAIAFAALVAPAAVFAQSSGTLTGKMAAFNYVYGPEWKCTANVPAMAGQAAHTDISTVTFDVAPANVMHVHILSQAYVSDQYFGYDQKQNMYWSSTADSMGGAAAETSSNGTMYKGSMSMGPMSGTVQDTYTKVSNNKVNIKSVSTLAGQSATTTVSCSR